VPNVETFILSKILHQLQPNFAQVSSWLINYIPDKSKMADIRNIEKPKMQYRCNGLIDFMKFGTMMYLGLPELVSQ